MARLLLVDLHGGGNERGSAKDRIQLVIKAAEMIIVKSRPLVDTSC